MIQRSIPSAVEWSDEVSDWRPVDHSDGEESVRASVRLLVKVVHNLVRRDLDDRNAVDRDARCRMAVALEAVFLCDAQSCDSYAFLNETVGRQVSDADTAWNALVALLTSTDRQHLSLRFLQENMPLVVFVKYRGSDRKSRAMFQPWIRVRQPTHGGAVTLPELNRSGPIQTSRRYVPAYHPAPANSKTDSPIARDEIGIADAGETDTSGVQVAPSESTPLECVTESGERSEESKPPVPPVVVAQTSWPGQNIIDALFQDLIEERRESRRANSNGRLILGGLGLLAALIIVFHIVMYVLESSGVIERSLPSIPNGMPLPRL